MLKNCSLIIPAIFLLALANLYCANSAVIGLDLGSEYMKISSIRPGKSFYIVEDTTTKRKTPTAISFHGNERFYEYDTIVKRPRAYQTTFNNLPRFLGKFFNDPEIQEQAKTYLEDYMLVETEKGIPSFKLKNFKIGSDEDVQYQLTPQELLAMVFRHVKHLVEAQNERRMKDTIVAIPAFWNFRERYALHDSLLLAGLNPISFVHENTAAALYYSLERQDNETHTAILYNLGSTSLEVSLVEFQLKNSTEEYMEDLQYESFEVIAEAWDNTVGGLNMDLNLVQHFAKEFDALPSRKGQKSVLTSNPAKAKLLKEVNKLKEVLSANKQAPFYIENLFESTDFKSNLDRTTFEEINAEIFAKLTKPIDEVLAKANKTLSDVHAIELIGGGIRVPKVQQVLSEYLGEKELGFHLNGDESMALGAAFHGANFSASFKTRKIFMSDGYNFDIKLDVKELESGKDIEIGEEEVFFPYKATYGTRKTLTLDYEGDVKCEFSARLPGKETDENVVEFTVTGLKEGLEAEKFKLKELGKPKLDLQFRLNSLGFVELTKAEAVVEETIQYEEIKKKEKKPAVVAETTTETTEETAENTTAEDTTAETETDSNQEKTETSSEAPSAAEPAQAEEPEQEEEPEKIIKTRTITHRIPLKVETKLPAPGLMTQEELDASSELLDKFDHFEEQKKKLAEAKNRLEAFLYSTRDDLEEELFTESAKEEEKTQLREMLDEYRDWLESEEASKSDHGPFLKRFEDMFNIVNKIKYRVEERLLRPELFEKAKGDLALIIEKMGEVRQAKEWITEEAVEKAKEEINAVLSWLGEQMEKQNLLGHHDDPILTTQAITDRMTKAVEAFNKLRNTLKPRPPKNETDDSGFYFNGGKFDEESFKEYMKKMNVTFNNTKFGGAEDEAGENDLGTEDASQEQEQAQEDASQEQQEQAQEGVTQQDEVRDEVHVETPSEEAPHKDTLHDAPEAVEPQAHDENREPRKLEDIDL